MPVQKNPKLQECIKKRGQKEKIERKDEKMKSKVSKKKLSLILILMHSELSLQQLFKA